MGHKDCDAVAQLDLPRAAGNVKVHVSLGNVLLAHGELAGAAASYRRAIASNSKDWIARIKLAHVLKLSKDYDAAMEVLRSLAAEQPDNPLVHKEFGRFYFARQQWDDAEESFLAVLRLNPRDADAHHWLANLHHLRGNADQSQQHFERTVALNPLLRVPAIKTPASFSALLLFAPGAANTPPDALVSMAEYDSYFLVLLAGVDYDLEHLRSRANVVVNLISDVDQGRAILPAAASLVDRLGLPVVNHPRQIMKTDRESVATLLSDIRDCRVPWVQRCGPRGGSRETSDGQNASTDLSRVAEFSRIPLRDSERPAASDTDLLDRHSLPLLVRVAGAHGGKDFEKIEDPAALAGFMAEHPGADFYLSEYVDYRWADGFFRKYRLIFIAGEILPYHLAIDQKWKVHHGTTDMANHPWMQREEEAFLNDPTRVFKPKHFAALRSIQQAVGLDYFGIDCSIDRQGNLVVFEVNASMLVHRENAAFAYKTLHVDRIKGAFDAMLENMALRLCDRL